MSRILIVAPSWVGDMIMAQTLFKTLKAQQSKVEIHVIAPAASLALASRMEEVCESIPFSVGHGQLKLAYRREVASRLKQNQYSQAIILPNSLKSALVPFFADIPVRTGFRGEWRYGLINDMRLLNKTRQPRMIDRFVALADADSPGEQYRSISNEYYPALSVNIENRSQLLEKFGLNTHRPILGICPGAEFGDAKRWPEQHFSRLAEMAIDRGMAVWIFGGPGDVVVGRQIIDQLPQQHLKYIFNLTGETTLLDALDLMSTCDVVLSNDSGLMHLSAALGCKTVAIFGSTSADFTPPLADTAEIVTNSISCSPCFKRTCPLGHKKCLTELLPEQCGEVIFRGR